MKSQIQEHSDRSNQLEGTQSTLERDFIELNARYKELQQYAEDSKMQRDEYIHKIDEKEKYYMQKI